MTAEESIDLIIRLYLECELKEVVGPAYDLMVTNKSDLSQEAKFILEEDNLPHYQLIVAPRDGRSPGSGTPTTAGCTRWSTWRAS